MNYSLNTIILEPLSKVKPKNAVILCHGYGGDGKDISILAGYWRSYLPETIFICPDAPEKCSIIAINCKRTRSCINLFEYFLLVLPPLNKV